MKLFVSAAVGFCLGVSAAVIYTVVGALKSIDHPSGIRWE